MFTRFWILWLFVGLSVATWVFWWAVRRGQFEDGRRAGLLPLDDIEPQTDPIPDAQRATPKAASRGKANLIIMLSLAIVGVAVSLLTIVLSIAAGR